MLQWGTLGSLMSLCSVVLNEFTCRLYGFGLQVKQVDEAREITAKNICGSSLDQVSPLIFQPYKRVVLQLPIMHLEKG